MLRRRRQSIVKQEEDEKTSERDVHVESIWHMDIDTRELRWESYVKAGYYVRHVFFSIVRRTHHVRAGCSQYLLLPACERIGYRGTP